PAMPDWSPVRRYGGYGAWGAEGKPLQAAMRRTACCDTACGVHGHAHANAWASEVPASDLKSFWGALGCACWAV
ncbi:amidohydrolase, partial [Mitsuaria sp. TWR114]